MTIDDILVVLDELNIEYTFCGSRDEIIQGYSPLNDYIIGSMTWVRNTLCLNNNMEQIALAVLPNKVDNRYVKNQIICDDPKNVFFEIMERLFSKKHVCSGIEFSAYISKNTIIGEYVSIGHNSVLDGNIRIGRNTTIGNSVSIIGDVIIGENCTIKSGCIIGHGDLDYETDEKTGKQKMIKQFGGVLIGNNVWVGPNTVINKGTLGKTKIGDNVIIDALCCVSHNVIIGKNTTIITGTKLFGSSQIGDSCYISTSIVRNQISIGDETIIGMGSVVVKDIPSKVTAFGNPAVIVKKR